MKTPVLFKGCLILLSSLIFSNTYAQRYLTEVFNSATVTHGIAYGSNYSVLTGTPAAQTLVMDIFEPTGDTETNRPVIVYVPAGEFLPKYLNGLPFGDSRDSATVEICTRFAKMGYVVAAVNQRTGWNPLGTQDERTETYLQAVYRSIQDARTAVRWFRYDEATNGNTFGIDPNKIVCGGQESGGYTALGVGHLDKLSELQLTKFFNFTTNAFMVDTAVLGDWNGFGGNPSLNADNWVGFSSEVSASFNFGGAMMDSTWIDQDATPVISVHGVNDAYSPFGYGIEIVPTTGDYITSVSGSSDVIRISNNLGNNDTMFTPPISDPYTTAANSYNTSLNGTYGNGGDEGLFPIVGAADGNFPWAYWDDASVTQEVSVLGLGLDANTILSNAYAANPVYQALGPVAGRARAHAFIDTLIGYTAPRLYRVLFEGSGGTPSCEDYGQLTGNTTGSHDVDFLLGQKHSATAGGEVTSLGIRSESSGQMIVIALYTDNAGQPGTLITQSAQTTLAVGDNIIDVPDVAITAGDYWIMKVVDGITTITETPSASMLTYFSSLSFGSPLPTTYPVGAASYNDDIFATWMVVCAPAEESNDLCADAETLECGVPTTGTTVDATDTDTPTSCNAISNDLGVWYTFTGTGGDVEISTCGSTTAGSQTAFMAVYSGPDCSQLGCVANSLGNPGSTSCGTANSTSVAFTSNLSETYYLFVTANSGFPATIDFDLTLTCSTPTGILASNGPDVSVYPNPSNGQFVLEINGMEADANITVTDISGRNVYTESVTINGSYRKPVSIDVAKGTYLLQITSEQGVATQKIQVN